ncbi:MULTISPECIES: hypothetical protein [Leptospira]|uniref:Uncharacterized protein n=2 Tax=Leptospira TaxID=171 RepID=A0A2M9XIJ3_9LEPT|nr:MULTISPECIES: hypothetical protein [Leptospira]EIE02192.1 hypothetical protein LEP1GSC185_1721 [Leptospira licerasiae serovar Varillal str. VAR 010]EJZ40230.1 hypothetical protein LEP1GSC178_0986 [Leptospira licerasiae str. MMD4847]PJZ27503.1 hypothetical protein CH357_02845 [Leptospira hartskeerlii]PJZ32360.1 hypothetical protein CH352_17000 [Leptospira hartskeerlii]TGM90191.1 hypothetical protein EHR05_05160 [Leptospira licerasiae]
MGKIIGFLFPNFIGLIFILLGWWTTIINVATLRFSGESYFNKWTYTGLALILVGAYLPEIWIGIRKKIFGD